MQTLYVLQGAPGSGKSTLAAALAAATGAVICSTDDLFIGPDGVYRWDAALANERHAQNQQRAAAHLAAGRSVIVDNTNVRRWEARPYVVAANRLGVEVAFIRCVGQYPSTHGVPPERVAQMRASLEALDVVSVLASERPAPKVQS